MDFSAAQRKGGWSNATWAAGGLVARVATEPDTGHLLREARLACILPPEVGCPQIVETGVMDRYEWVLSEEICGQNLGDVWLLLDWDARIAALRGLWARAGAVHSVDVSVAEAHVSGASPFYAPDMDTAVAQCARLERAGVLISDQVVILTQALDRYWGALGSAPRVLNHGDLCLENALWYDDSVVALLDFEYAIVAPVELDLNELLKCVYAPPERDDPLPDPDGSGLARLQQAASGIAVATVSTSAGPDLVLGFAILLEMWMMERMLSQWDGRGSYAEWQPYRTLTALTDGAGGYLAPVLARLQA
ncbi:MAG: aminoglycoside phosphotransferase family protein [Chloroflexi bacterium]|nr:aminoglycoside phosphotransferase family protein [Chloroflexota bacterium]